MSRRSGRLQAKQQKAVQAPGTKEEEESFKICSRKRKAKDMIGEEDIRNMEIQKRRQQFQIQNCWIPISQTTGIPTSTIIPTQFQPPSTPTDFNNENSSIFRFKNLFPTPSTLRSSPLPTLNWADHRDVWRFMLEQENTYLDKCDTDYLHRHPHLETRMRAILLDWLIEVSEVYKLHRETYYLSMDFVDRFLSVKSNIPKNKLQLIGITALFIAAKLEEIYPPKLSEFAYVTDGACTESEILDQELIMLKALNWDLTPITANTWLNTYLQLCNVEEIIQNNCNFVFPNYSASAFVQIAQLIDLCTLDITSLQFHNSTIAASAFYHMSSEQLTYRVTSLRWDDIAKCVQWMSSFAITIREAGLAKLKMFPSIMNDDAHNIQTHVNDLTLLDKAQEVAKDTHNLLNNNSPVFMEGILTPPQSSKKTHAAYVA
ncbi:G1/S-specific cyclin-E-like [Anneissia japonica]|uniref:G1/S-specific cyclin-E-like n=1 Tax=Anneissia japonica TaxID=1529436 RepID=UPI0014256634|nr:G1/S-specific cyclin-E-like [Anneissia japonica]XP_033096257.1 G1/S-specific cyclin-E-like [Anneissia japonica]